MKLTEHFDSTEFKCNCGNNPDVSKILVQRLEELHGIMAAKAVYVNSGYRCPNCSVAVGGFANDAHTLGLAADISVQKQDGSYYTGYDIAEVAERVGFGGIGIMNNACHVDTRDCEQYANNHWFGNELTGENAIRTFQRGTVFPGEAPASPSIPGWTISKILSLTWLDEEGNEHTVNFE